MAICSSALLFLPLSQYYLAFSLSKPECECVWNLYKSTYKKNNIGQVVIW